MCVVGQLLGGLSASPAVFTGLLDSTKNHNSWSQGWVGQEQPLNKFKRLTAMVTSRLRLGQLGRGDRWKLRTLEQQLVSLHLAQELKITAVRCHGRRS